jgi:hypothetical protein
MDQAAIIDALIAVHTDVQTTLGHANTAISPDTCPLTQLPGFDSPAIPTAIRMTAQRLGLMPIPGANSKNLYISEDRRRKLTIREIAGRIAAQFPNA